MSLKQQLERTVRSMVGHDDRLQPGGFVAAVLGSGLGAAVESLEDANTVPYSAIDGFPTPTVAGHGGRMVVGRLEGTTMCLFQGRVHLYEGHAPDRVVHGVRSLALAGAQAVLLTNAAGGIDPSWSPGDLMVIDDHINLTGSSPLLGLDSLQLGTRFPDVSRAWDPQLSDSLHAAAQAAQVPCHRGVYVGVIGPQYETPAEVRMMRIIGGHAAGMSTVHEVIALAQMGCRAVGLSTISNLASGVGEGQLDHDHISGVAGLATERVLATLRGWLRGKEAWWRA